jgi:hypothetical protein
MQLQQQHRCLHKNAAKATTDSGPLAQYSSSRGSARAACSATLSVQGKTFGLVATFRCSVGGVSHLMVGACVAPSMELNTAA